MKEEIPMSEISVLDLQNLRHLIGGFDTCHCKMQDYEKQIEAFYIGFEEKARLLINYLRS